MNHAESGPLSEASGNTFVDRSPFGNPPRVKIQYRYCDYRIGERLGETVLTNTYAIAIPQVKKLISVLFYDGLYFDADRCGLPCLARDFVHESEQDWHELLRVSATHEACSAPLDLADFLTNALKQHRPQPFASRFFAEQPSN